MMIEISNFIAYDAKLNIINLESKEKEVLSMGDFPMLQVKFIAEGLIVTTGHNYSPIVVGIEKTSGKW